MRARQHSLTASTTAGGKAPSRPDTRRSTATRGRRLLWFVGLWLAGVAAVGAVAGLLRAALGA